MIQVLLLILLPNREFSIIALLTFLLLKIALITKNIFLYSILNNLIHIKSSGIFYNLKYCITNLFIN
jgi:hypothetical protein